ncbi:MAG: DUF4296 domain-containing protein [Bacteroidales bacterium]|nr:DUF4296 domain-containing protein [Bacteroidales bacterium]
MQLNRSNIYRFTLVLFSGILLGLTSCNQKKQVSGSQYIERNDLVDIIKDMHLMDGITNDMQYYRKFNPGDSIDIYSSIFEKYNVDREAYERTIKEYSKHPKLLDAVYDDVLMKLSIMQDELEEEENREIEKLKEQRQNKTNNR